MKVKISELKNLTRKAINKYGYSKEETKTILNILMYAQLRGNNQGILKLIGTGIPRREGGKKPKIVKETPVSALYDGSKTHAMIVMDLITDKAIEKAKKSGIGITGNFNTDESTGALGYYAKKITSKNLVGIVYSSSPFQTTAPYQSTEALFCTNPMAYGIPTEQDPVLLDMSTSAIAYYGLIEAKTANRNVSGDVGYDKSGKPTPKPEEIMAGAIKAFGGYKGSGLALIVQIFASSFVRADYFNSNSSNSGNMVIAIDPKLFVSPKEFKNNVTKMVKRIKGARKLKGVKEIYAPGERGNRLTKKRLKSGYIDVEDSLYKELQKVVSS